MRDSTIKIEIKTRRNLNAGRNVSDYHFIKIFDYLIDKFHVRFDDKIQINISKYPSSFLGKSARIG